MTLICVGENSKFHESNTTPKVLAMPEAAVKLFVSRVSYCTALSMSVQWPGFTATVPHLH